MKTKRLIYAGLATTLFSSSLINVPAQVSAAESSSSSSISSATNATSEVNSASKAQIDSSASSQKNVSVMLQQPSVQTSNSRETTKSAVTNKGTSEPVGTPNNADTPSSDGWSFILTILRRGFSRQPESEQYIALQDISKAKFSGMSILTNLGNGLGKTINVRRWKWDEASAKWDEAKDLQTGGTGVSLIMGSLGFLDIQDYSLINKKTVSLDVGTYYYQFNFNDFFANFYSNLAKVVIVPTPKPAKTIDADTDNADKTPKTVYSDVDYVANAVIDPKDSTDIVGWSPTTNNDKINLTPSSGRKTTIMAGTGHVDQGSKQYIADDYYVNKVNQNPNQDGIPAQYTVSAGNATPTVKNLLVGGLPAFNGAADGGGSWHVGGLDELAIASGATSVWNYQWVVTDSTGKAISLKNNDGQGVKNVSGSITNLADLNTSAALSFAKDSTFMKEAAKATATNKSYQFQLKLNTTLSATKADDNEVAISSNKAELQATPATGKLTLDKVPNFAFGNVEASSLYGGIAMASSKFQASDTLQVTDTRATTGWNLSATMSKMTATNSDTLNDTSIYISGLPDAKTATITDDNVSTDIIASKITGSWPVTGRLGMKANPNLNLTKDENFKSNITWTLTSTAPVTKALK